MTLIITALGKAGELTSVLTIKSGRQDIVKLKNERPVLCKERDIAGYILEIGPYDAVASGWFRSGCTPD